MFCPLAIDWGNAADWASAIASTGAVIAAVWIVFGQERNARKLRRQAQNEEHERKAHLTAELIRLTAEIQSVATSGHRWSTSVAARTEVCLPISFLTAAFSHRL